MKKFDKKFAYIKKTVYICTVILKQNKQNLI